MALVPGALALWEGLGWGLAIMVGHGRRTLVMGESGGLVLETRARGCLTLVCPLLEVGGEALEVRL